MVEAKNWLKIGLVCLASTFLLWAFPLYFFNGGLRVVESNYDGPLYIVVAKTFYDFSQGNRFEFPLPNEYYAAHFPLYPGLLRIAAVFTSYPVATLGVTLLGSLFAALVFYAIASDYFGERKGLWMGLLFLFLPARYFAVRSVGSPEPFFVAFVMLSVYAFSRKNYWMAGLGGALAVLTKSPGVLLFAGFLVYWLWQKRSDIKWWRQSLPIFLVPIALLSIFGLFKLQYNDFWAYFNSGDNIHLQALPFRVFDSSQPWVGDHWLEDIVWVYLVGLVGLISLLSQKRYELACFVGVFLFSIFFVSHRDVSRYSLPIMPFVALGLGKYAQEKHLKLIFWVILLPVYLYSLNFIIHNTMAISDWAPLL